MIAAARDSVGALLIAPTGGGKTLAGFLPSLIDLAAHPRAGLHTLYVSPLKALATDIARNLMSPIEEMALPITVETRSGDTPANRRARQKAAPPNLLLTTPESLALLLSQPDAHLVSAGLFAGLSTIVIDEVHALAGTKRGDQLALGLARLTTIAPGARRVGLSATVAHRQALLDWVGAGTMPRLIEEPQGAPPALSILLPEDRLPWSGHMGLNSASAILQRIAGTPGMTIVFVNTRAQGELLFQALWRINADTLPIALHHGSLDIGQRRKVEAAMAEGRLRAVVATSSLDLGIDWGGIDQVIQIGAPKGTIPASATRRPRQPPHGRGQHRPSGSRPTGSRRWSARPRSRASPPANSTASRRAPAAWTYLAQHLLGTRVRPGRSIPTTRMLAEVTSARSPTPT